MWKKIGFLWQQRRNTQVISRLNEYTSSTLEAPNMRTDEQTDKKYALNVQFMLFD
jgi:hypothetical protein